jgi:hypothetical protein
MSATLVGRSAPVFGTTTATPGSVASIADKDLAIIYVVCKRTSGTAIIQLAVDQSGWEGGASSVALVGTGSPAADAGIVTIGVFAKRVASGTLGTLPTVTASGGSVIGVSMSVYRPAANEDLVWTYTSGTDVTADTSWAPTGLSDPGFISGDIVEILSGVTSDTPAFSSPALTATGATFAAVSSIYDTGTTSGNDERFALHATSVTSGSSSGAPSFTATMSTGTGATGGSMLIRIRSQALTAEDNLCPNPGAGVDTTGYSTSGTLSRVTGQTGAPRTTAARGTPANGGYLRGPRTPVVVGTTYFVSAYYTVAAAVTVNRRINWYTSGGSLISSSTQVPELATANVWQRGYVIATAPATAATVEYEISPQGSTTNMSMTAVMVEDVVDVRPYGDGGFSGWVWDGTAENSSSHQVTTYQGSVTLTATPTLTVGSQPIALRTAPVKVEVGSGTSISANLTGGQVGDFAICFFAVGVSTPTSQPTSSGWTAFFDPTSSEVNIGAADFMAAYYKVLTGGDTCTVGWSGANVASAHTLIFTGVNPTTPLDTSIVTVTSVPSTTMNLPSVTTVTPNSWLISCDMVDATTSADTAVPAGMTQGTKSAGTGRRSATAYEVIPSSGATGVRTWTQSGTTQAWGAWGVALRPSSFGTITSQGSLSLTATPSLTIDGTVAGTQVSVRSRNQGAQTSDSTSHPISLPAGIQVGDLLYVAFSIDTATTITSTSSTGWQKLIEQAQGTTTNHTGSIWWKRATGSDSFTIDSSTAEKSTHISIALQNASDPEATSTSGASSSTATPVSITPSGGTKDYLSILSIHTDSSAGTTQNFGTASGYSNSTTQQASTTTSAATNTQEQLYPSSSGFTPGTVSLSLAEQWVAITTAIGSSVSATTLQASCTLIVSPTLTVSGTVYKPPDSVFDLSNWKITVPYDGPDGNVYADEIIQPDLATYVDPRYFYLDGSNRMVMDAPVNGDTTSGSSGVRTELREMDGAVESAWNKTTASRQLTVSGYFDPTNITGGSAPKKVMIVGQIHETSGTPGIYLTVDYDASPSRLRVFKDGPGVGNLATGFTPTDKLAFRIECTGGNVNIYGSIGDETTLPASPQFTFPASGFAEVTGSYLKTGSYHKTDTGTGSTGDAIATITYLNLNQALTPVWQATLSLTATPTLTVNAVRTAPATLSLTATPTLSVNAVRIVPATLSLTATPTLGINAYLTAAASVALTATPTLSVDSVRTTPASVSLSATPTLSISAPQLAALASITLSAIPTLSISGIRYAVSSISLVATPTLVISSPALVEIASVSLIASPTLTANATITGVTQWASLSLSITPTISVSAFSIVPLATTLIATPTLSVDALRTTPATLPLTVTPTLTVNGFVTTSAFLALIATPSLTVSVPSLTTFATTTLIISPMISIDGLRIAVVSVALNINPTLSIAIPSLQTAATVSLIVIPALTINAERITLSTVTLIVVPQLTVAALLPQASISLVATPTFSVDAIRVIPAVLSLIVSPTISVSVYLSLPAALTLIASPTLNVSPYLQSLTSVNLTATPTISLLLGGQTGQVSLFATSILTIDGVRVTPANVSLIAIPTLAVNAYLNLSASFNGIATPTLSVDGIRVVPASIQLTITPTLTVTAFREQSLSVSLVVAPTFSITLVAPGASVALIASPTIFVTPLYKGALTAQLTATPTIMVGGYLGLPLTLELIVTPTLTVGFFASVPATVSLIATPSLNVDGTRYVPANLTLVISPVFSIDGVRFTFPIINLTITPTLSVLELRIAVSSVYLLIIPTLLAKGYVEGAGPGWPIVFRVVSVDNGEEPVPSEQTEFKPTFALQSVRNESTNQAMVSNPYIDFEDVNA